MKHKRISVLVLIAIILFTTIGCQREEDKPVEALNTNTDEPTEHEPEYGGQLVLPLTTLYTLNPLITENASYYYFSKLIFECLFELDKDLNIINQLADDYTINEDGSIDIRLKKGVKWHDGEEFTAEDVAFTINTIKHADEDTTYKKIWQSIAGAFGSKNINRIMDVEIIDDYNIKVIFDGNFSHGLEALTFPIIPRHRFVSGRENRNSYSAALEKEDYIPIGTGPYKFVDYEKYKSVTLEAFDGYRDGRPYIHRIIGKILEDDELALTAFETGQVDLVTTLGTDWEKFDQNNRVRIFEFVSQNYEFLGFNFSKEIFSRENANRLRKAIAYGIDRQAIIQRVYLGHATQTDLPIHPDSWLLTEDANVYGYNLNKAKEELEKLGWRDLDGDGFYEDENGQKISLRLLTNSYNPLRLKVADMIVEDLNKLGLHVVKDYPETIPSNLTDEMVEGQWEEGNVRLEKGDYDIVLMGWHLSPVPELSLFFHSNQISSNINFIRYSNEAMDDALYQAFNALGRDSKKRAYNRLQTIIIEELPYVSLFFKNRALLIDKKIMGDIDPNFHNIYRNIDKWYIPKEFQQKLVENE
ncbi:MAG: peptide ABC transporter substrate-binding protein [Tissierellia bacterium]|nr:peptide ABC transporter substrate-binding protein [Tissierellia bacterium]